MKGRLSSTLTMLAMGNALALIILMALAYSAGRTSGGGGRSRPLYGIADCGPGTTGTISKHVASIQETESDVGGGVGTGGVWNVRGRDCICSASAGAVRLGAGTSVGKYFRDFFGYARSSLP